MIREVAVSQRLQAAQYPIGTPVLGQFHRGTHQVPGVLFQLALKALKQGEGIRRTAGEAGDDAFRVEAADLARIVLHDGITHGDLAVTADDDLIAATDAENGRAV